MSDYNVMKGATARVATRPYLTIFFNVDRADQLDCRRWRDNIKKAVRNTLRGVDKMNSRNSNTHVLENVGFLMYLNTHEEIHFISCS